MDSHTSRPAAKVLLVDDDQTVLQLGAAMLSLLGYEVCTAHGGEEAVAMFTQIHQELSVVVLDLSMPYLDGPETLTCLQAINSSVPIVLSSGYSEDHATQRIGEKRYTDFLPKPYTLDSLQQVLAAVLA
jgi:two-component system, cell cycle sensor histidine kinase and response regulator CckA